MDALKNPETDTWHLVGSRGCGAEPDGQRVSGTWAELRDEIARSSASRCRNCRWPR